jgi:hypothetical protein
MEQLAADRIPLLIEICIVYIEHGIRILAAAAKAGTAGTSSPGLHSK